MCFFLKNLLTIQALEVNLQEKKFSQTIAMWKRRKGWWNTEYDGKKQVPLQNLF